MLKNKKILIKIKINKHNANTYLFNFVTVCIISFLFFTLSICIYKPKIIPNPKIENEIILFVKDIFSFKKDNANAKKKENVHIAKITST